MKINALIVLAHVCVVALAQDYTIEQVHNNLMYSDWAATIFNDAGTFENGTGIYHFTNDTDRRGRVLFTFYVRTQGSGEWGIREVNKGDFVLTLTFQDVEYSPFRNRNPVRFKIINPFDLDAMDLILLPDGPDQLNEMTMTKEM